MFYDSDICVIGSGTIRSDTVLKPYKINFLFIDGIIDGPLMVKLVPGKKIREMLEHSVESTPDGLAGAFLCVSGLEYHYDYNKSPRVQYVSVGGKPLDEEKLYTLTTTQYIAEGGDGYDLLKECKAIVSGEKSINLEDLILKFFSAECIQVHEDRQKLI